MQQIFVDLGSHYGAILNRFARSKSCRPGCIFHAFEANPLIPASAVLGYPSGTIVHRVAAGTLDGEIPLYINTKRPTIQGSSIFREKTTGELDKDHPVMVPCIDFGAWLEQECAKYDRLEVIVKMNIEGAEYPLLEDMLDGGTLSNVWELRVKWHWHKIGKPRAEHDALVARLAQEAKHVTVSSSYEF